jgi:hypothetical protein
MTILIISTAAEEQLAQGRLRMAEARRQIRKRHPRWKYYALSAALLGAGLGLAVNMPTPLPLYIPLAPLFAAVAFARILGGVPAARLAAIGAMVITCAIAMPELMAPPDARLLWLLPYLISLVGFTAGGPDS